MNVDLSFHLSAQAPIPADHGYSLFGALSRMLPNIHCENEFGIHPIQGRQVGNRQLSLLPSSRLTIRLPAERIAEVLPLAGSTIQVESSLLAIGTPHIYPLRPSTALYSRLVVIKVAGKQPGRISPEDFMAAVRKQMESLGCAELAISKLGKRRTLRIKQAEIVGYELLVENLSADESLDLQLQGLGGRRHMGCGLFTPIG